MASLASSTIEITCWKKEEAPYFQGCLPFPRGPKVTAANSKAQVCARQGH